MSGFMSMLDGVLVDGLSLLAVLLELMGAFVILRSALVAFGRFLRFSGDSIGLPLAHGLALGLAFLLGSEILLTATARNMKDVAMIGGVFLLRALMSLLIHWEMGQEAEGRAAH
ncbi:MAG: DUF1622 domain-containing protein [Firmicutes bacterium]|nr:DUF1622 domain-containing protein [Bacillota bacterium]